MHPAPAIQINNATLSYQHVVLFNQLNVTLAAGKWTCLLGPSGVGKTSLLRLIAGLTANGSHANAIITSDGLPLAGRLAYMAQSDLLLPWYSALNNVLLGVHLRAENKSALQDKAVYLLEQVGLKAAIHKRPDQLSGGMRQRVALARTLMEDRPVVLMDEPFASLDAITRVRLQALAAELLINRTVLLVTHDPLEAIRLGDAIYVMAGLPVTLSQPLHPSGKAPRDPLQPGLLTLQAELLQQLTRAQGVTEW